MANYYVNQKAQPNGDHEVHKEGCPFMPNEANRQYLGDFPSCHGAVKAARRYFPQVNGGKFCSPQCHTQ